jgi:hypothetical protein
MPITDVAQLAERVVISDHLNENLSALYRIPTAVMWNRLEGRPRSGDLGRPLRAEVRDPLWMLCRQWQFGEFAGEDAGSPVKARLLAETTPVSRVALRNGAWKTYDASVPVQPLVERSGFEIDLMMSLYIGQRFIKQLSTQFGVADPIVAAFRSQYAFAPPAAAGKDLVSLKLSTDPDTLAFGRTVAQRAVNGAALLAEILGAQQAGRIPSDAFTDHGVAFDPGQKDALNALATAFHNDWFNRLFPQSLPADDAWLPSQLEYQFALGVTSTDGNLTDLPADRFSGGHFDWYSLDAVSGAGERPLGPAPTSIVSSFVPTPVRFHGAPNARWWEFEETRVGFGLTTASKTDLVKMLLAEFGLVFSNDWFIVPLPAKVGTMVETKGIVVSDNFGMNTLIEPVAKRHAARAFAGTWGMWTLSRRDQPGTVDTRFFLAPTLAKSLESRAVDEVVFLRDEMANLVWGLETITPDPLGGGQDARGAAQQLRDAIAKAYPQEHQFGGSDVLLAYQLMGRVPEDWIPFVPVRLKDAAASTAFLQGAMPRVPPISPVSDAAGPVLEHNVVLPRGTILSRTPVANPNVINEEEILRGGAIVRRTFEQVRWTDGSTWNWSSRKKLNGRGEGSSGLAFDQAVQRKPA